MVGMGLFLRHVIRGVISSIKDSGNVDTTTREIVPAVTTEIQVVDRKKKILDTNIAIGIFITAISFLFLIPVAMLNDSGIASRTVEAIQVILACGPFWIFASLFIGWKAKNIYKALFFSYIPYLYPLIILYMFSTLR